MTKRLILLAALLACLVVTPAAQSVVQRGFGPTVPVGAGGASGAISSVLTVDTTQAGTGANTNETDLWTYSLPANTLSADGKAVRITVFGSSGANGNTKTMRVYVGATVVNTRATTNNGTNWEMTTVVIRTGASAQLSMGRETNGNGIGSGSPTIATPAADTTAAITIKFTGQNGTGVANDVVFKGAIVEALN